MDHTPPAAANGRRRIALKHKILMVLAVTMAGASFAYAAHQQLSQRLGRQPDGSFLVSTEQRIEPGAYPFAGRPIDMAINADATLLAVLNQNSVLLLGRNGALERQALPLGTNAGFRGILWSPDSKKLFVSIAAGYIQEIEVRGTLLRAGRRIPVKAHLVVGDARPGGMAITQDGTRLFVALADRNAVAEIDIFTHKWVREYPVDNIPFEVKLTADEKTLIVTNWGGRQPTNDDDDDEKAMSGNAAVVVDPRGAVATGSVCLIQRDNSVIKRIQVGAHPTAIALQGDHAYITNAGDDSLSEIDLTAAQVVRTLPLRWGRMNLFGSMPCALAIHNNTAYVCNGGDNALCQIDLTSGKVVGFRPVGFYPIAMALNPAGTAAYVLNTKGNGSVQRTLYGRAGNVHDFQGTLSAVDLTTDLKAATARVETDNGWNRDRSALHPHLSVYGGAIKHVLYIIKENRTYDQILGDLPQGNGDSRLCDMGQNITPNAHALAQQFCLFDNAYVSGTNSSDGHQWCTQALANDYMEHFYVGYRTFSFAGDCAMSISNAGCLWDAALKRGRTIRDYGEFCDGKLATFTPPTTSWQEVWKDRASGKNAIRTHSNTHIVSLRPYVNKRVLQWPLLQSDQERADLFLADYKIFSRNNRVPNLMFLSLPCDHTEGRNPNYPTPQAMVADNDLALGRVVEAVSHSPQWKSTCIFVIEDDAQFGWDHVDGHRTVYFALSPYTRQGYVDHELCNTVSMIRSIELMLGIDPMNRFDALTPPLNECFTDTPDLTSYTAVPNRIALDQMNPPRQFLQGQERYWTEKSMALDWSGPDRADPHILNQVIWHTLNGVNTPYPTY